MEWRGPPNSALLWEDNTKCRLTNARSIGRAGFIGQEVIIVHYIGLNHSLVVVYNHSKLNGNLDTLHAYNVVSSSKFDW